VISDISDFSNGFLDNYEASRFMLVSIETDQLGEARLTFRHISELAGDVMRRVESGDFPLWEETDSRSSYESAPARPATGRATTKTLREGHAWPSMQREEESMGARAAMGEEGEAPGPASLLPITARTGHGRVRKASIDMTTAYRRNESDAPRSAVVISMMAWKAERRGHTILQRKITTHASMTRAPAPPSKTYT
jgi:hypothetical protein